MICGHCKAPVGKKIAQMFIHWALEGCPDGLKVWARFAESKAAGHSGRRILHEAWPDLYPSEPMTEETKQALRELADRRKEAGVVMPQKRRFR